MNTKHARARLSAGLIDLAGRVDPYCKRPDDRTEERQAIVARSRKKAIEIGAETIQQLVATGMSTDGAFLYWQQEYQPPPADIIKTEVLASRHPPLQQWIDGRRIGNGAS